MKKIHVLFFLLLAGILSVRVLAQAEAALAAQADAPVLSAGTKVTAKLRVRMDPGWHISSLTTPDGGPVRTVIALTSGTPFKLAGKIQAPEPIKRHSEAFGVDVETYEGEVEFTLPLEATAAVKPDTPAAVEITYQVCSEENCLLPRTDKLKATVSVKAAKSS
jgi:thiol:disulfide interchange protein DsbD